MGFCGGSFFLEQLVRWVKNDIKSLYLSQIRKGVGFLSIRNRWSKIEVEFTHY